MGVYALIKVINSVETIDNEIVASEEISQNYLVANGGDYDYVIEISAVNPAPGIGWTYDAELNAFTAPPEDFQAELESALYTVDGAIEAALLAYENADSEQRGSAVTDVMGTLTGSSSENEMTLMQAVMDYLAGEVAE